MNLSYYRTLLLTFITIGCVFLLVSCDNSCDDEADVSSVEVHLKITRLENELFGAKDATSMERVLLTHRSFTTGYLEIRQRADVGMAAEQLVQLYNHPALNEFNKDTQKKFGDLKNLESELTNFFKHVKFYYPKFSIPEINTLVSGFHFEKDLFVSDSLIAISLDYFLGRGAKYRPPYFNYFLERYEQEFIVPMIGLGVSTKFNEVNLADETMLGSMVFYGKAMYFSKRMMPCADDSLIVMYTGDELKEVQSHAGIIWAHFIEQKLLFETNRHLIDKYVGETPKVNEIGPKCPGRIGRWLGWEIVKSYMKAHPEVTLQQLMAEKDAQKIFRLSKYKPEK